MGDRGFGVAFWLALLVACSGGDGAPGASALLRTGEEPPGDNCPGGGTVLAAGSDGNGDGVLADAEVSATSYVCNGAADGCTLTDNGDGSALLSCADGTTATIRSDALAPESLLVRTTPESPGEHCEAGGVALSVGSDTDADGVLDDAEVLSTSS